LGTNNLIGKEYRSFDGKRRWELLFEHVFVVILDTGIERGRDFNLVGIDSGDLRVKWVFGGALDSASQYDGVVSVWVEDGRLWAGTWSGMAYQLDHRTGEIQRQVHAK
jgi:outer membrane protein assembly factor BamB